jgi:hypothetical protein
VSFWNENSFWYYTSESHAKFIDNTTTRFQEMRLKTNFPNDFAKEHDISYVHFDAAALKDGAPRYPGLIDI